MKSIPSLFLGSVALLGTMLPANATLLVYEGFNYALSNDASIGGVTTTATGLTGNYGVSNTGSAAANYKTAGLSFGSSFFASTGGSLSQRAASGGVNFTGATISTDSVTGDLWGSYLFYYDEVSGATNTTGQVRLNTSATAGSNSDWFNTASDITAYTRRPQISYDGGGTTTQGVAFAVQSTYLLVSKFTNVGTALSVGTPGVATLWIFDQASYESWVAGGSLEADLDTAALGTTSISATSGTYDFDGALQFAFYNGSATAAVMYVDEIRYGTELSDVVSVIPEPSHYAMMVGGLALVTLYVRRRRA